MEKTKPTNVQPTRPHICSWRLPHSKCLRPAIHDLLSQARQVFPGHAHVAKLTQLSLGWLFLSNRPLVRGAIPHERITLLPGRSFARTACAGGARVGRRCGSCACRWALHAAGLAGRGRSSLDAYGAGFLRGLARGRRSSPYACSAGFLPPRAQALL